MNSRKFISSSGFVPVLVTYFTLVFKREAVIANIFSVQNPSNLPLLLPTISAAVLQFFQANLDHTRTNENWERSTGTQSNTWRTEFIQYYSKGCYWDLRDNIDNLIQAIILLLWLILFWINDWYPVFLWDWLNIYSDISLFIIVNLCIVFFLTFYIKFLSHSLIGGIRQDKGARSFP